ncbi:DNA-binding transcriptional regulator [Hydrogenophaga sp. BPS33]|uniref:DNA-binding transcriptional regulator n=1 Tax=Hydrogenophaga sp. BPS33 TaxID=2651974 RepID=UPI0013203670|nr:DNA-binding transcriptional regulator [Hydrogenophaga sp. BPS33]QHE86533.1 DNA-binding transcriptional regulator [Hydrogenophaga sp. BPS33]
MASFAPIRSVERALDVLLALNRGPISTLDQLYQQTRIPKPTLVRLLETLQKRGMVARAPQYGAYSLSSGVKMLSAGYHGEPRIVEAAAAPANALTRKIKWPLAVAVPDYDAVVVRYSTIPDSPLSLLHSTINMRLSLVGRAMGRAYLAFCGREERRALLDILNLSSSEEDASAKDRPAMLATLKKIRQQGYALRAPGIRPVSGTLAVPVMEGQRVVATLGMTWIASAVSNEQAVERYLEPLQGLSRLISTRLVNL